ncbi:MAG: SH3 domain-containing protein [Elusimicrobia bacterium]|nr:SH3 domain-containing protein [Elusimicrobiota bacterium]
MKFIKNFIFIVTSLTFLVSYTHGELSINDDYVFFVDGEDFEESYEDSSPAEEREIVSNTNFIPNGPLIITDVTRNMKTAGYWISKIKNPDKEILTAKQIQEKKKELFRDLIYLNDIENFSEINTSALKKQQKQIFKMFYYRKYIDNKFNIINKEYVNKIYNNINIPGTKKIKAKYAITTSYSDIRLLPTDKNFLYDKATFDIDRMQVASVDIGTPLIALISTKDKQWTFVISYESEGWIKTKDLAFTTNQSFLNWINENNFIIVTDTKTDLFLDEKMTKYHDYIRMSTKLPVIKKVNNEIVCVKIPKSTNKGNLIFEKAYLYARDINTGYLKYTQRNVLQQAFKHMNSPYSWGGYDGEQDCSTFIRQVFGCFGLILPRNSLAQIKSGNKQINISSKLSAAEKSKEIISKTTPAISLLYLPGHIMLYVGEENNTPYAIHAIWGTENFISKKEKVVSFINKVVVSNLSIGEKTSKKSLLHRIKKVNTLTLRK